MITVQEAEGRIRAWNPQVYQRLGERLQTAISISISVLWDEENERFAHRIKMRRFEIARGELYSDYEPYDLPGASIPIKYKVRTPDGSIPENEIQWSGVGQWIESRDGVPDGYRALWLGRADVSMPLIVWVAEEPTTESNEYDRGYRRGWKAKRKPVVRYSMSENEVQGVIDGWKSSPNNLSKTWK